MLAISTSNFNKSYSAVVPKYDGFLHPLHSIFPKIVWEEYILDELHKGESSITKLISKSIEKNLHKIEIINEEDIGLVDPMFMSLIDIDDKESLNLSRRIVEKRWNLKKN